MSESRTTVDDKTESYDIFVSYSRKDLNHVEEIVKHIRSLGMTVWFDRQAVAYGARIRDSIIRGIHASRVIIVVISEHSLASRWVLNELDAAMIRELNDVNSLVVPIVLGRIKNENIPIDLRAKNYLDLRHNFRTRWLDQKNVFSQNMLALVKGESYGPEATVLTVGDPFIRYLALYSFQHKSQSSKIEELTMARIAWAFGIAIANDSEDDEETQGTGEPEELPNKDVNGKDEFQRDKDDPSGKARDDLQRFLRYRSDRRRFVQRYGEFSLQQLVLLHLDKMGMDLTGGFSDDQLIDLFSQIRTILTLFSIQFAFEDAGAASTHGVLARITKDEISFSTYGNVTELGRGEGYVKYRLD